MKSAIKYGLLLLVGTVFVAALAKNNSYNNSEKREIKKEFQVKAGGKLEIDLKTGSSIEVYGWDKEMLSATAYIKNDEDNKIEFEFSKNGNDVEINSDYAERNHHNHSNAKLVVWVPNKYDVEFSTMGGEIKAENVEGKIAGKTMGGEMNFTHLKGYMDVTTMGGGIKITDSEVDGKAKTMGGEVLLENIQGDLNASSMGGAVRQKNVQGKNKSIGKEVNINTMGGEINVDNAPNGAKLKTMGGEITVNKAGDFADVETMGGDIEIKEIDGWVKAKTMGGDINVCMIGNAAEGKRDVLLTSMGGDVTLTVPEKLAMNIDIEIAYTRDSKKDFAECKVISDFSVKEERSTEWDKSKGSPRKYITATGSTGDGKNKVKIRTINGNVYLKKA